MNKYDFWIYVTFRLITESLKHLPQVEGKDPDSCVAGPGLNGFQGKSFGGIREQVVGARAS